MREEQPVVDPGGEPGLVGVPGGLRAAAEAILMVVDAPVKAGDLAAVLGVGEAQTLALLVDLAADYRAGARGFELREAGGGWRIYSRADLAEVLTRFVTDGASARLSRAALETLAVIAYRQPVTRARVAAVRGVNVDSVVRTLAARALIEEAGREEGSGAVLYRTTSVFLERLGASSLADLPPLAPHLPADAEADDLSESMGGTMGDVVGHPS